MKNLKLSVASLLVFLPLSVLADIPVIDITHRDKTVNVINSDPLRTQTHHYYNEQFNQKSSDSTNLSLEERIKRLERQISYLNQLKLSTEVEQLQRAIEDLRGLVEVQGHELQELQKKQRDLYADLDKRISSDGSSQHYSSPMVHGGLTTTDEEVKVYEAAFDLIKKKHYSEAILNLHQYLKQYPDGQYVVNAHYWLGELFVISGDPSQATAEFNMIINNYSHSEKVPDALLKLGIIAADQSNYQEAKEKWQTLVRKYPNSSAARIAKVRLEQLQRSGLK